MRKPEGLADERYELLPTEHTLEDDRFRGGVRELGWVGSGVIWEKVVYVFMVFIVLLYGVN